jgi:hypothetical protein
MTLMFVGVIITLAPGESSCARAADAAVAQTEPAWHSPSLRSEAAIGPNGRVSQLQTFRGSIMTEVHRAVLSGSARAAFAATALIVSNAQAGGLLP